MLIAENQDLAVGLSAKLRWC